VLAALAAVHDAGAAHRDVGFGNVIVCAEGPPSAWLTDFGACQIGDAAGQGDPEAPLLRPLQPPPYGGGLSLADETARDVYAFAVVATMTLTGSHPLTDRWRELTDRDWRGPRDPHRTMPRRRVAALAPWLAADPCLLGLAEALDHCLNPTLPWRQVSAGALLAAWPNPTGWP